MALLKHNEKIYKELKSALKRNKSVCFIHGTGLGKSFIFFEIVSGLKRGTKVLYVVPKWAVADMIKSYEDYDIISSNINITFVTYNYFKKERDLTEYDLVVFDEVHHIASTKYGNNALESKISGKILGLTATNVREDKIDVANFFDTTVVGLSTFDAIRAGLIPPFEYLVCSDNYEERASRYGSVRDFRKKLTMNESLPLLSEVVADNPRNRWICFFRDIEQLTENEEAVRALFPKDYELIKITTRHDGQIADVTAHDKTVILCVDKLLEGIHVPDTKGIILFRNVGSLPVFQQILGRVVHVGSKKPPVVLDCTSAAIKMLSKLLKEDKSYGGDFPVRDVEKPLLYCSLNNRERFNLTKLLALAQAKEQNPWTSDEIGILKKKYGEITNRELRELLPAHTISSIQAKAASLGLKSSLCGSLWTDEEKRILKDCMSEKMTCEQISKLLPNRTPSAIKNMVKIMGLKWDKGWKDWEIEYLNDNYGVLSTEKISKALGRTKAAIKGMAKKQGFTGEKNTLWTKPMIEFLKENYQTMQRSEIAEILSIQPTSVTTKASALGLKKGKYGIWTKDMDKVLKRNYKTKSRNEIASILNVKPDQISSRANYLGLQKREASKSWTDDMILFLKNNYSDMDRNQIAEKIGVEPKQVTLKAAKLGLKKREPNNIL